MREGIPFIFILLLTTAQLIIKMLMHLVSRLNMSTLMKEESLVLMQTFIKSVSPWVGTMHLDSDKCIKYCSAAENMVYLILVSSSCVFAQSQQFYA